MIEEIESGTWQPEQTKTFVFLFSLQGSQADFLTLLDENEKERANRFYFEKDRQKYIAAHGQTRLLLARFTGQRPQDLKFTIGEYGKPYLADHPWQFNLSHSGDYGLIAVSGENKTGVDIEQHRPELNDVQIARRFFSEMEQKHLFALPEAGQKEAFFRIWARKEAVIKAVGHGLQIPLHCFDVEVYKDKPARLHRFDYKDYSTAGWSMFELQVPDGYSGALVICGLTAGIYFIRI